jgi:hypothetical protein
MLKGILARAWKKKVNGGLRYNLLLRVRKSSMPNFSKLVMMSSSLLKITWFNGHGIIQWVNLMMMPTMSLAQETLDMAQWSLRHTLNKTTSSQDITSKFQEMKDP